MPEKGWQRRFDDPIPVPRGLELVTLEDAGTYITKLPKAEHEAPEWQAAMEALILVATKGGPTMLARIGIMRALHAAHFCQETSSQWSQTLTLRDYVMSKQDFPFISSCHDHVPRIEPH